MAVERFRPGQHILYRGPHVDDSGETGPPVICDVKPVLVVEDSPALISLYLPAGTNTLMSKGIRPGLRKPWGPGDWELVSSSWDRWHTLFLIVPGEWRATWVMWNPTWEFQGWYVNFQEPLCRTRLGFDIRDLQLDIVVAPDRTWRWKDEDEFDRAIDFGIFSGEHAATVRRAATESVAAIERRRPPFDDSYRDWRPPPYWSKPDLPSETRRERILEWSPADAIERC
ncbi:MAG: DUF402 domain-containing protein [Dehalococcoidia bacterium]